MNNSKNGRIRWIHLWMVMAGIVSLGAGALALHSGHPHTGAMLSKEQDQFEKRIIERLERIESNQRISSRSLEQLSFFIDEKFSKIYKLLMEKIK